MSKVITFSRNYPAYHPKAGQPTFFIQKIWSGLNIENTNLNWPDKLELEWFDYMDYNFDPKHHTIRAGNRWKVGDKFSPRVWSGKPYNSKQIIIAPDIEIKKLWDIEIKKISDELGTGIFINGKSQNHDKLLNLAANDGLNSVLEMLQWFQFPKPFTGQIICWNENIEY